MRYDFVDIGTCDFDTSVDVATSEQKVLLVEPLKFYLDRIPDAPNITKANLAIGNTSGTIDVKYVPESVIHQYNLHWGVKGCTNVGEGYHKSMYNLFNQLGIPLELIVTEKAEVITFQELCKRYEIDSINTLKVDTEGYEQYILPDVLDMVREGFRIDTLKYENQETLGNKVFIDYLTKEFLRAGYTIMEITSMDTTITKQW